MNTHTPDGDSDSEKIQKILAISFVICFNKK